MKLVEKKYFLFSCFILIGSMFWLESILLKALVLVTFIYIYIVRVKKNFRNRIINTELENKLVYAPATGRIKRILRENESHYMFLTVPPMLDHGIYLPVNGSIKGMVRNNVKSYFRFSDFFINSGVKKFAQTYFDIVNNEGDFFSIGAIRCKMGLGPRLCVDEEDIGLAGSRAGEITFGGVVYIKLPLGVDCLVGPGEFVEGGKTVIARFN